MYMFAYFILGYLPPGFFGMFQFKKFKQIRMLVMYKIVDSKSEKNALLMFNAFTAVQFNAEF